MRTKGEIKMLIREFEQRTGYYPSAKEYAYIEQAYCSFDGDKDAFCAAYKDNKDGIAERIQRQINEAAAKEQRMTAEKIRILEEKVKTLQSIVEAEQEWQPYGDKQCMGQSEYDELAQSSGTSEMTDAEAKALVYNLLGFAKEKVDILRTGPVYEINRHRQLRKIGEKERKPLYNATDWNYVRFVCEGRTYELQNDELQRC